MDVDGLVIQKLIDLGFETNKTASLVSMEDCNSLSALYFLLLRKLYSDPKEMENLTPLPSPSPLDLESPPVRLVDDPPPPPPPPTTNTSALVTPEGVVQAQVPIEVNVRIL